MILGATYLVGVTIDLELLRFIQRNAASGQALLTAKIVQPGDVECEFVCEPVAEKDAIVVYYERSLGDKLREFAGQIVWLGSLTDPTIPLRVATMVTATGGTLLYGAWTLIRLGTAMYPFFVFSFAATFASIFIVIPCTILTIYGLNIAIRDINNNLGWNLPTIPTFIELPEYPQKEQDDGEYNEEEYDEEEYDEGTSSVPIIKKY